MKLLESHSYLSEEEIELKHVLKECIQKFFQFYDKFIQNRTKLESNVFDHFQEIRFHIDEHREELKKRIDDIALAMIAETKICEEKYLKEVKKSFSSLLKLIDNFFFSIAENLTCLSTAWRKPITSTNANCNCNLLVHQPYGWRILHRLC